MADDGHGREITLDQMMALRAATEAVSGWLRTELADRLESLRPLLVPRRYLGDHVRSAVHEDVKDADKVFELLQTSFREVSGEPLRVSSRLDSPLEPIPGDLQLHPWEYAHEATSGSESRKLTVKSPVSWVLTHAAPVGFGQVRQMLRGEAARNDAQLRQFALNAVLMKIILDRSPGIGRLLQALRLTVSVAASPDTGKIPLCRLTSCVPAFRPADGVILSAVKLSGVPIFEELVDVETLDRIEDPIRAKVRQLAGSA
jgi:hypothetical protein